MKLESNYTHYFKCYNEAKGVASAKRWLLKNPHTKVTTHIENICLLLFLFLLLALASFIAHFYLLFTILIYLSVFYFYLNLTIFIVRLINHHHRKYTAELTEEGLIFNSFQNIELLFRWPLIKKIIIKKYSITILTSTSFFFFFDISYKDQLLAFLKKAQMKS